MASPVNVGMVDVGLAGDGDEVEAGTCARLRDVKGLGFGCSVVAGTSAGLGDANGFAFGCSAGGALGADSLDGDGDQENPVKVLEPCGWSEGVDEVPLFVEVPKGFCGVKENGALAASSGAFSDG